MKTTCLLLVLFLPGCVMGIRDSYTPPPKPKPCEKKVVLYPKSSYVCMTNEQFAKWMRREGLIW